VANQDRGLDLVRGEEIEDVSDVGVEAGFRGEQRRFLGQPGQGWRPNSMPLGPQERRDPVPAPPAMPTAVDEDERGR
jgi:hypothetical protein